MDSVDIEGRTSREVVDSVERAIREGRAAPGDVLPSVRALAKDLKISPGTVAAAYRDLRARGVLTSEVGKYTRISTRPPLISRIITALPTGARDLSDGNPDPCLLPSLTEAAHATSFEQCRYGDAILLPGMSELAVRQFTEFGLDEDQTCLVGGAMDGVERVLTAWLKPGDAVIVEDPSYTGVLDLIRSAGMTPVAVAIDERGPLPSALRAALRMRPAACVFTPRAQNPTGAALDADRAAELTALLRGHPEPLIIENDHAGPVSGHGYHSLTGGRRQWAVIRSVSKTLGPDLRLAFLAGDPTTVSRVEGRQRLGTGWVSHVLQRLVLQLFADARTRRLISDAERTYTARREGFIAELAARGIPATGRSGLNVAVPVSEEAATLRRLQELGWVLRAGEPHRLESPPFVRVTISALDSADAATLAGHLAETLHAERRSYTA